jgi:hypothetical protein
MDERGNIGMGILVLLWMGFGFLMMATIIKGLFDLVVWIWK